MKAKTDGTPRTSLDFICDIIARELSISPERVLIWNERTEIPKDDGLFVLVGYSGGPKIMSSRNIIVPLIDGAEEHQEVNVQEMISISVCSKNIDALLRKEEVVMALSSLYAQNVQEANSFKIFRASAIEDLSSLEGAGMLNRYQMTAVVFAWYSKTKVADYFDTFSGELWTEKEKVEIPLTT